MTDLTKTSTLSESLFLDHNAYPSESLPQGPYRGQKWVCGVQCRMVPSPCVHLLTMILRSFTWCVCVCVSMGMDVHVSVEVRRPHTLVYTLFETGSLLFTLLNAQLAAQELSAILFDSDY